MKKRFTNKNELRYAIIAWAVTRVRDWVIELSKLIETNAGDNLSA